MAKRKRKRNARRFKPLRDFKIRKDPIVHLGYDGSSDVHDRIAPPRMGAQPVLFAIARDAHTIFASWEIDWRAVFETAMPADRQVHLRLIAEDGVIETTVVAEPMRAMHYLTISGTHNSYRVEIGYFQPIDTWNSVARSDQVEMPPQGSVALADVDLATIPFHLSFQQLADLFETAKDVLIASAVSEFQKRLLINGNSSEPTRVDRQIRNKLNLSFPGIAVVHRDFRKIHSERLARRTHAMSRVVVTSLVRGFQANCGS